MSKMVSNVVFYTNHNIAIRKWRGSTLKLLTDMRVSCYKAVIIVVISSTGIIKQCFEGYVFTYFRGQSPIAGLT